MDNEKQITVTSPLLPPLDELIPCLRDIWERKWLTNNGHYHQLLEKALAEYLKVPYISLFTNGTLPLITALQALRITGEVITTPYSFVATTHSLWWNGIKPVFVDIEPETCNIDPEKIEAAITPKTTAIMPVHVYGKPCDTVRIQEIADKYGLKVIYDAAHAFGAEWHGKKVGSIADFSNFSFHAVKNFTTAEGGAATWKDIEGIDNEELYHKYQLLSLHGQSKDALAKTQLGAWEYDIVGPWYKCNMTDVVAGIGLAQMKRYKGLLARRKEIIGRYDDAFKPLGIEVLNHYADEHQSSGHLYITRIPGITLEQRHEIIVKMAEKGIACNVHYKPLPMMTAYKNLGFDIKDYPNAYKRFENEITLPLHTKLTDEEVEYVIENYCEIVKNYIGK